MPRIIGTLVFGYASWKILENQGNTTLKEKHKDYDREIEAEKRLMVETIFAGGSSDWVKLREETTKKRLKIAEENTVYAPIKKNKSDKE